MLLFLNMMGRTRVSNRKGVNVSAESRWMDDVIVSWQVIRRLFKNEYLFGIKETVVLQ